MAESFTKIAIEVQLSAGVWTDITADVLHNPRPRVSGMGFSSHAFDDVVGDAGKFTFSLDNSEQNSAKTLGYYSPQGISRRTGWGVGKPVRLYFQYDGYTIYKFYGYIDNDGIQVDTGRRKGRRVHVTASNWLKWAADQSLALMTYKTNMRIDQGVYEVLQKCTRQPLIVKYNQGNLTFPTLFDAMQPDTKALSELQKLAISELGFIFISGGEEGGEILHIKNKNWVSDATTSGAALGFPLVPRSIAFTKSSSVGRLMLETGTDALLEEGGGTIYLDLGQQTQLLASDGAGSYNEIDTNEVQVSYGKYMFNRAKLTTYPRTVDASVQVLWNLEEYITLAAGETISDIRGQYRNNSNTMMKANGIEMVIPVATTDYKMFANSDGTGVDRTADLVVTATFGTAEVNFSLTNNNASTSYVTFLQVRGKGVYINDPTEKVYDSTTQQATFGIIPANFDFPYVANMQDLFSFAAKTPGGMYSGGIFTNYDDPIANPDRVTVYVNRSQLAMMTFLFGEPGKQMTIFEKVTDSGSVGTEYGNIWDLKYIRGYDFEIVNMQQVKWYPSLSSLRSTGF